MNVLLLMMATLSNAQAAQFYMWGLGATGQTNIYPFGYPLALPTTSVADSNPKENLQTSSFVGSVGGKFVAYIDPIHRASFRPVYSFGSADSGYSGLSATIEVDRTIMNQAGIQVFLGAGIGTGGFQFDQGNDGLLSGRNLFLKGHAGGIMLSAPFAFEIALFAEI